MVIYCPAADGIAPGQTGHVLIRPERIGIVAAGDADHEIAGVVTHAVYLGTDTQYGVSLDAGPELQVRQQNSGEFDQACEVGQRVNVILKEDAARLLDD